MVLRTDFVARMSAATSGGSVSVVDGSDPGYRCAHPGYASTPFSHRLVDFVRRPPRPRIGGDHEQHGETGVLTHEGDQLDDAALANERRHGLEVGVANLPCGQQLRREIVHRGLVR